MKHWLCGMLELGEYPVGKLIQFIKIDETYINSLLFSFFLVKQRPFSIPSKVQSSAVIRAGNRQDMGLEQVVQFFGPYHMNEILFMS